jgi:hypothetical protein
MYYLLDLERSIPTGYMYYWKAGKRGYTTDISEAGLYHKPQAKEICESDKDQRTIMINEKTVERLMNEYF